jgi:hypothetical protein
MNKLVGILFFIFFLLIFLMFITFSGISYGLSNFEVSNPIDDIIEYMINSFLGMFDFLFDEIVLTFNYITEEILYVINYIDKEFEDMFNLFINDSKDIFNNIGEKVEDKMDDAFNKFISKTGDLFDINKFINYIDDEFTKLFSDLEQTGQQMVAVITDASVKMVNEIVDFIVEIGLAFSHYANVFYTMSSSMLDDFEEMFTELFIELPEKCAEALAQFGTIITKGIYDAFYDLYKEFISWADIFNMSFDQFVDLCVNGLISIGSDIVDVFNDFINGITKIKTDDLDPTKW